MHNPIRSELIMTLHRDRVAEGLRRAAYSTGRPPDERRLRLRRRPFLRLRMA
jgi:hypothetical protein